MSLFQPSLSFSVEERALFPVFQHITWLAHNKWNVFAVFQNFQVPTSRSEALIDALSQITANIVNMLQEKPGSEQPDIIAACLQWGTAYPSFSAFHSENFWAILLREFWRATPPPYRMTRDFNTSRLLITGIPLIKPRLMIQVDEPLILSSQETHEQAEHDTKHISSVSTELSEQESAPEPSNKPLKRALKHPLKSRKKH